MSHFILAREGNRFYGHKIGAPGEMAKLVFAVKGSYAAKAAIRLLGIVTPIEGYFFDNPHGSHTYNVCDDPNDPYLGVK